MQGRTIDNALLALRKQMIRKDRDGLAHVEALLIARFVPMPAVLPDNRPDVARNNITYAQLVKRLAEIGVDDNARNLRSKVSIGKFTAGFFLQCLTALGCSSLRLDF